MIPPEVTHYLQHHRIPFQPHAHPRAVEAQHLAQALHVSGRRVAKCVLVAADGRRWLAVVPANKRVDEPRLAEVLGAQEVHLLREAEFESTFPCCEPGAEPPFGRLFNLPVVADLSLKQEGWMVVRAGAHDECLELAFEDFERLEQPVLGRFSSEAQARQPTEWPEVVSAGQPSRHP